MAALDLTPWIGNDSPELAEFKKRVIRVAEVHSRRHHCGSTHEALHELGLNTQPVTVRIEAKTSEGYEFSLDVDPFDLSELDEDGQKDKLAELFATKVESRVGFKLKIPASSITQMEITTPTPEQIKAQNGWDEQLGVFWLYSSSEGRVQHAFRNNEGYQEALCGRAGGYSPPNRSARAEHRRCSVCEKRLS